ncbi:hypothetical protein FO440_19470 [Mucilaginibacter corticis]|uniref:YD repeat-containing protein n=1 Tax=Mucilaginibacter corticis TaxID=2597670 RepID=A0A556MFJ9_9SPHI|nr:hypothetical protein [Mucilaginibacter corticis]TSJ38687.1 hypothetical protein FO440_19470 [Mucilaginibacter corticis]
MINQILKSLFITAILTTVFTNCFCQVDPWITNKTYKDSRLKGRVDSCVTNIVFISYKDSTAKKQLSAKIVEYYNKHNEIIKKVDYMFNADPDTAEVMKRPLITAYNYNKKGGFEKMFYRKSKPISKDIFTYADDKTAGILKQYNLPDNKLSGITKIKLNARGDIEESVEYRDTAYNAKPFRKINYEYNQNGFLTKYTASYTHTTRTQQIFYTYDQDNNMIQVRRSGDPEPSIEVYTYPKFDKSHNWLEEDMYVDGKLIYVFERRIVYHK